MGTLTEEQLKELEEFAGLFFSLEELELIMELPIKFLQNAIDENLPEGRAVKRGQLLADAKLRTSIFNLASNGSGPAQVMAQGYIDVAKVGDV